MPTQDIQKKPETSRRYGVMLCEHETILPASTVELSRSVERAFMHTISNLMPNTPNSDTKSLMDSLSVKNATEKSMLPNVKQMSLQEAYQKRKSSYEVDDGHAYLKNDPNKVCFCGVYQGGEVILCSDILNND